MARTTQQINADRAHSRMTDVAAAMWEHGRKPRTATWEARRERLEAIYAERLREWHDALDALSTRA